MKYKPRNPCYQQTNSHMICGVYPQTTFIVTFSKIVHVSSNKTVRKNPVVLQTLWDVKGRRIRSALSNTHNFVHS